MSIAPERRASTCRGPLAYGSGGILVVQAVVDPNTYFSCLVVDPSSGLDPVVERCDAQWRYMIERVWLHLNAPSEEEIASYIRRAWQCAKDKGILLPSQPNESDLGLVVYPGSGCEPWNRKTPKRRRGGWSGL